MNDKGSFAKKGVCLRQHQRPRVINLRTRINLFISCDIDGSTMCLCRGSGSIFRKRMLHISVAAKRLIARVDRHSDGGHVGRAVGAERERGWWCAAGGRGAAKTIED